MLQIFDCAFIIGWRLLSHGATVTLLVSQLRRTHIDLYRLPPKSIMNPRKECQKGASGWWWLCRSVCATPAMASCFVFCSPVFAIKMTAYTACKRVGGNASRTQIQFSRLFFFSFLMQKKPLKKNSVHTEYILYKKKTVPRSFYQLHLHEIVYPDFDCEFQSEVILEFHIVSPLDVTVLHCMQTTINRLPALNLHWENKRV